MRGFAARSGAAFALPDAAQASPQDAAKRWETGAYSFSDELGGFHITGASGSAPRTIRSSSHEEIELGHAGDAGHPHDQADPAVRLIPTSMPTASCICGSRSLNNSELPWIEFEFELQEHLHEPSVFGDGLSFDQRRTDTDNISSTDFREFSRDFEPYDRLLFRNGKVDPLETRRLSAS